MTINVDLRLLWAYIFEILLATVIYIAFLIAFGAGRLAAYIDKTCNEWNDLTGLLFSASLAIWLMFVNLQATNFGDYLRFKKQDTRLTTAFIWTMIVFLLATVMLVSCPGLDSLISSNAGFFMLIYCAANLLALIRTATQLVNYYGEFKRLLPLEMERLDAEQAAMTEREDEPMTRIKESEAE